MEAAIPFPGFYYSILSDEIDSIEVGGHTYLARS